MKTTIQKALPTLCQKDRHLQMSDIPRKLNPHEQWMVRSNLKTIAAGGVSAADQVALLVANGYPSIAAAVEEALRPQEQPHAVFYTLRTPTIPGEYDQTDHYEILPNRDEAFARYRALLEDEQYLYCAGYGPIIGATEPQWKEGV